VTRSQTVLAFGLFLGLVALAPQPGAMAMPQEDEAAVEDAATETVLDEAGEEGEFDRVEEILQQEEDMIQGAYSYQAGRRRDPFISLVQKRKGARGPETLDGECPTGCLIDEVTLTGIFVMPEGPVAQIQSPDQEKSFLIRIGDEFHDGNVVAITADSVRFRQVVDDLDSMKPFRAVTKTLSP